MDTRQALVAIGGRATRLRAGGVSVPISKSFIPVAGQPLLHWCLVSLHVAGVRDLVLSADRHVQVAEAKKVLSQLPVKFDRIRFFSDKGYGVHGLPYYAQELLADKYIFECGHSVTDPEQYQLLDAAKRPDVVVFSAFRPHPENVRYPVRLVDGMACLPTKASSGIFALAHPFLVDRRYSRELPSHGFNIDEVMRSYIQQERLRYVFSEMPPEFDIAPEMELALRVYSDLIQGDKARIGAGWL